MKMGVVVATGDDNVDDWNGNNNHKIYKSPSTNHVLTSSAFLEASVAMTSSSSSVLTS